MTESISTICLPLPFNFGTANCYLISTGTGFLLIDTGAPSNRALLEKELEHLGCRPGLLRLIVITHGDFDHTGCAVYLRQKFGAKIAMHPDDAGMAEHADMFCNRKNGNFLLKALIPALFGFGRQHRFFPDVLVRDGFDLSAYGLDACLLSIPGHSKGSIGLLTASGNLFCGDLLMNDKAAPALGFGDPAPFGAGIARLKGLHIHTVYPGHGKPFSMDFAHLVKLLPQAE